MAKKKEVFTNKVSENAKGTNKGGKTEREFLLTQQNILNNNQQFYLEQISEVSRFYIAMLSLIATPSFLFFNFTLGILGIANTLLIGALLLQMIATLCTIWRKDIRKYNTLLSGNRLLIRKLYEEFGMSKWIEENNINDKSEPYFPWHGKSDEEIATFLGGATNFCSYLLFVSGIIVLLYEFKGVFFKWLGFLVALLS